MTATAMLGRFVSVEIVRTGAWPASTGKAEITADKLSAIVANYELMRDDFDIPLKLGHGEADHLLEKGLPAAGWVTNLRIRDDEDGGQTLLADIETTSDTITELILSRAYRKLSVEIHPSFDAGRGKVYKHALIGLAMLGAELPAASGMAEIADTYVPNDIELSQGIDPVVILMESAGAEQLDAVRVLEALAAEGDEQATYLLDEVAALLKRVHVARNLNTESITMKREITQALGLAHDASEDDVTQAILKLQAPVDPAADPAPADPAPKGPPVDVVKNDTAAELAATKAQVAELSARDAAREKRDIVTAVEHCVDSNIGKKLLPASRDTFISLGMDSGIEKLQTTIDTLPDLVLQFEIGTAGNNAGPVKISDEDSAMALSMGIDPVDLVTGERLLRGLPAQSE